MKTVADTVGVTLPIVGLDSDKLVRAVTVMVAVGVSVLVKVLVSVCWSRDGYIHG